MDSEETVEPYISDVSADGVIELGFSEPMLTTTDDFADPLPTAIRKLTHDVYLRSTVKEVPSGEYEVFDAIEI